MSHVISSVKHLSLHTGRQVLAAYWKLVHLGQEAARFEFDISDDEDEENSETSEC